jgi:acetyl esterase/lipase
VPEPHVDLAVAKAISAVPSVLRMIGLSSEQLASFRAAVELGSYKDEHGSLDARGATMTHHIATAEHRPDGVPLLVIRPPDQSSGVAIFFLHGGGLIAGNNRTGLERLVNWCVESGVTLISVEYRLAPEHSYVEIVDDCYVGLVWAAEHHAEFGFSPKRLMLAGVSAGGGLAASTAILARDRNGPALSHQILFCPMLDHRLQTKSSGYSGVPWDRDSNHFGWQSALGNREAPTDEAAALLPILVDDLRGLPPTYLDVGAAESFRDEVIEFAGRLLDAGVPTELHVWYGGTHGFDKYAEDAIVGTAARSAQFSFLDRVVRGDVT